MSEEKSQDATPKKLRKARKEGQVAKSAEFTSTATAVVALAAAVLSADVMAAELVGLVREAIEAATAPEISTAQIAPLMLEAWVTAARVLVFVIVPAFVVAALVAYLQVGPVFSLKPVIPDGSRLNPSNGFKQLFAPAKLVDLAKNVGKIVVMGSMGAVLYLDLLPELVRSSRLDLQGAFSVLASDAWRLARYLVGGLIVFAIFDLIWQRYQFAKKMRMSKQDIKDEYKEAEGSPEVKGRRRQLHRELLAEGSVSRVKDADAVVVNPTEIAVAIVYREPEMEAPQVLARGRGPIAAEMRRLARKHDIPIVRDVPLARALVLLEDDEEIPEDLFEAVAEVLRYVYSLQAET